MNLEDFIKDLNPELQEKARACGSVGELLALAQEEQVPLPDAALEAIAGGDDQDGAICHKEKCPRCGSTNVYFAAGAGIYYCLDCGFKW